MSVYILGLMFGISGLSMAFLVCKLEKRLNKVIKYIKDKFNDDIDG